MKFFSILVSAAPLLASVSGSAIEARAQTSAQMASSWTTLTTLTKSLAQTASAVNTNLALGSPYNALVQALNQMNSQINTFVLAQPSTPVFSTANASPVCFAFGGFVDIHVATLNTIASKGVLTTILYQNDVRTALRLQKNLLDSMAFGTIDVVPLCQVAAVDKKTHLDKALAAAVCAYSLGGIAGVTC